MTQNITYDEYGKINCITQTLINDIRTFLDISPKEYYAKYRNVMIEFDDEDENTLGRYIDHWLNYMPLPFANDNTDITTTHGVYRVVSLHELYHEYVGTYDDNVNPKKDQYNYNTVIECIRSIVIDNNIKIKPYGPTMYKDGSVVVMILRNKVKPDKLRYHKFSWLDDFERRCNYMVNREDFDGLLRLQCEVIEYMSVINENMKALHSKM